MKRFLPKRGFGGLGLFGVIRNFCWVWKKKISLKGRSIDDWNEYKFIYVPSSSSSEKKASSTIARFLIFFPRKFEPGWRATEAWIPCDKLLWLTHFFAFWSFLVAEQNFNFRFLHPCYKRGAHHTEVKRGARAQFPQKLSLNKVLNFRKFSLSNPKLRQSLKS